MHVRRLPHSGDGYRCGSMTAAVPVSRARTWPLERRDAVVLGAWFVGVVAVGWAIGALLTGPFDDSAFVRWDESVSRWFAEGRTATLDDLSTAGALLADTIVKIVVTALVVIVVYAVWRSWRDVLMIVLPLVLEASSFILITWLVGRPRPDVPRLEESPVDSSWPSGHTAAATAYMSMVVVVWWHIENKVVRVVTVVRGDRRAADRRLGPHLRRHAPPIRRDRRGGPRRGLGVRRLARAARPGLTCGSRSSS